MKKGPFQCLVFHWHGFIFSVQKILNRENIYLFYWFVVDVDDDVDDVVDVDMYNHRRYNVLFLIVVMRLNLYYYIKIRTINILFLFEESKIGNI